MEVEKNQEVTAANSEDTVCMNSEELVLHAAVGCSQSLDFSIPGTRDEQGHFVEANLASSIGVVVVERRVDNSWKIVGVAPDMHLYLDS